MITYLHVVLGELVPKGLALGHPERIALAVSVPVRGFFVIFAPFIWLLKRSTEAVLRWLGQEPPGADHEAHSEAELRMLLSTSAEQGEIESGEEEMLYKVFDFADKEVSDVMVPRPDVVALSVDLAPEEALQAVLESPYTRYPVYREHDRRRSSASSTSAISSLRCTTGASPPSTSRSCCGPRRWCPRRRTSRPS